MMAACIREEIRRLYRRRQLHFNPNQEVQGDTSSDSSSSPCSNTFGTLYSPSTRDKPLFTFRQTRRSYRRRQLHFNRNQEAQGDTSSDSSSSPFPNTFGTLYSPSTRDKPLFTFRQVGMICERMLTERETQIREEYDRILNMKLSEQYDAFVKFSNDQLHRRFELSAVPSCEYSFHHSFY
ncbi:Putative Akirin [Halyomorpha halys]|nr:Putative Akirin [Halyomorpha halys]